uniref:Uncharacterized protein n=1 Tax=Euglena viridis TaxID=3040 RepID=M1EV24_EUGVI|nr:hypothetical protein I642_p001 [Euglena viridis]AEY70768.1 hypothetical protein [Euglena viridis]
MRFFATYATHMRFTVIFQLNNENKKLPYTSVVSVTSNVARLIFATHVRCFTLIVSHFPNHHRIKKLPYTSVVSVTSNVARLIFATHVRCFTLIVSHFPNHHREAF